MNLACLLVPLLSGLIAFAAPPSAGSGAVPKAGTSKDSDKSKVIGTQSPAPSEKAATAQELDTPTLESKPFEFAAIGLAMRLPAGASVRRMVAEEFPAWQVESAAGQPPWSMRVQMAFAPDPKTDCARQLQGAVGNLAIGGATVKTLSERDVKVSGRNARIVWASATRETVTNVAGWMVVDNGEGIFVSLGVVTSMQNFADVESSLDASFATATVVDPRAMQAARAAQLERGAAIVKSLTPERLKALAAADGRPVMHRIWRRLADGSDQEVGWVETSLGKGTRGDASIGGSPTTRDASNAEPGLLLKVAARTFSPDGVNRVETQARYWVAFDMGAEAWSVRSTQRGVGPDTHFSQLGIRGRRADGTSGRELIVSSQNNGVAEEPQNWELPPTAYLPQALAMSLAQVLPRGAEPAGEAIVYALDASALRLCQRSLAWRTAEDGSCTLQVRVNPDAPAYEERLDARGARIDRIEVDGTHTTPSTNQEVQKRWNALGLDP